MEVFYLWHALYGRRLRRQYGEHRATGVVVHVEVEPGVVLVVAAWMLDAASCSGMGLGEPRASLAALADLHYLCSTLKFRRSSCGVFHTDYKEQDKSHPQKSNLMVLRCSGTALAGQVREFLSLGRSIVKPRKNTLRCRRKFKN